jgi:HAD superfamily hydrolase (TIGR01549 family)
MFDAEMLRDLYMERYMAGGTLYEGVIPLLDALRGRYTLGIVSNGFTEAKQAHLRRTGLDRYFDLMILSEDLGIHKPDPGIFQAALDAAGVTAREALFIGDSFYFDIHGAWQAGIPAIWYNPHGNEPPADLPEVRPVAVVRSIDELARLLGVSLDSSPL